ncbi:MAG: Nif11-like leader peptide family natural product precursor [Reyranella sp.]|jgi:predicted ribosomally synthesized peptide with nif11-like leader|nr:MAG: Nif11-like leader peptide family natural product precursor [Reyranella sp.]
MSQQEIERFGKALQADPTLQAEVAKLKDLSTIVATANRYGFKFTEADVKAAAGRALTDRELDAASGASAPMLPGGWPGVDTSKPWDPNLAPWGDKSKL